MKRPVYTIDATLKTPGRLASEVAQALMGKHHPQYAPHINVNEAVEVINIKAMRLNKKKVDKTEFIRHTLHPGGIKRSLAKNYSREELLRKAVHNMLPKNKLRPKRLKRLTIH